MQIYVDSRYLPAQSNRFHAGPGAGCSCPRAERGGARPRRSRWGWEGRSEDREPDVMGKGNDFI